MTGFDLDLFRNHAKDFWAGQVFYFPNIGSTNAEARARLHSAVGPREMLLIADKQTAGRGRLNRVWSAPFGTGLLCTLVLPLQPLPLDRAYLYTASLALALQQAAWLEADVKLDLKWPNDLLRAGRKCGGILAELEDLGQDGRWLALGFGLNTALTDHDLQEAGLADKAANLTPANQPAVSRETLLSAMLKYFAQYRAQLAYNPEIVRTKWAESLITIGQAVRILTVEGHNEWSGLAVGVDPSGGLLVRDDTNGQVRQIGAGDVSVRLQDGRYA